MRIADVHCTDKGGWKPQKGETIQGRVVDIDVTEGSYGPYPVLDVELEDGVVSVHAYHDLLRRMLRSHGAQIGEMVSITFKGRAGNGTGTDAYLYAVQVGEQPKVFDYDSLRYTGAEPAGESPRYGSERTDESSGPGFEPKQPPDGDDEIPF